MANNDLFSLITKLSEALLSKPKSGDKSGNKPVNASFSTPSYGGDFSAADKNKVSPKQSVVEMLRRHDEISRKIDREEKKDE